MRVLVIGGSGLVGSHVVAAFKRAGWDVSATWCTREPKDESAKWYRYNFESEGAYQFNLLLSDARPDVVVNCAAWPWVDGCQRMPSRSHCLNQMIPTMLAELCARVRIRHVFFSSAYVFGPGKPAYDELDLPYVNCKGAVNVYGDDKFHAEIGIRSVCPHALVVRTLGVFGMDPGDKCFASRLIGNLKHGKEFRYVESGKSNWTWAADLANDVLGLVESDAQGIVHSVGNLVRTRAEFASNVCTLLDLDESLLRVEPMPADTAPRVDALVLRTVRDAPAYDDSESLPMTALQAMKEKA